MFSFYYFHPFLKEMFRTNDILFESPYKEFLDSGKKMELHLTEYGQTPLNKKIQLLLKLATTLLCQFYR